MGDTRDEKRLERIAELAWFYDHEDNKRRGLLGAGVLAWAELPDEVRADYIEYVGFVVRAINTVLEEDHR